VKSYKKKVQIRTQKGAHVIAVGVVKKANVRGEIRWELNENPAGRGKQGTGAARQEEMAKNVARPIAVVGAARRREQNDYLCALRG